MVIASHCFINTVGSRINDKRCSFNNSNILNSYNKRAFFKLIDNCNKQGEFVATMKALKNECQYNKIYRGDNKNPFQLYWLEKALSHLNFYQQCNEIVQLALPLFELAKDCNIGQLEPRKDEAGQKIVPRDLQNQMIYIATKINEVIPELEKRTTWYGYLKFIYTSK